MKFLTLLAILSLSTGFGSAYATEIEGETDNVAAYCNEQAELAGIDDAVEKDIYISECTDSYATTSETPQSTD
ncbi:MAG: hypothetical protein OQK32_08680 [Gammaproteobacteria bacterium]|nr:hypothetical protein [Gammaproteobacteria bacterium]MCW8923215.1 hypothetical protein [Gammaproteobacteria bacterium]